VAGLADFPEVRICARRLDVREFGPAGAGLVSEVLQGGEWLPLPTALAGPAGAGDTGDLAGLDWWLADAVHEPGEVDPAGDLVIVPAEHQGVTQSSTPAAHIAAVICALDRHAMPLRGRAELVILALAARPPAAARG